MMLSKPAQTTRCAHSTAGSAGQRFVCGRGRLELALDANAPSGHERENAQQQRHEMQGRGEGQETPGHAGLGAGEVVGAQAANAHDAYQQAEVRGICATSTHKRAPQRRQRREPAALGQLREKARPPSSALAAASSKIGRSSSRATSGTDSAPSANSELASATPK